MSGLLRRTAVAVVLVSTVAAGVVGVVPRAGLAVAADGPGRLTGISSLPVDRWVPGSGAAINLTYRSTGPGGALTTVSGSLFLPKGQPPPGGWPVLSWAHGTVGLGDTCAPSSAGRGPRDMEYLSAWLAQGYAVAATDYTGLGTEGVHPYLIGATTAHSVIDAVRAARELIPGLSKRWVVVGQSQGGHATLFTANLATRYAPELDFRGAVAMGVPANLQLFVPIVGPDIPPSLFGPDIKTYVVYILAGLRAARPDFDLSRFLTPLGQSVLADGEKLCAGAMNARMAPVNLADMFTQQLGESFRQAWEPVYGLPTTGYDRPFLIAQGEQDTVASPALTDNLVSELAKNKQPYTYKKYPSDHGGTVMASLADSTLFVRDLLAG